MKKAFFLGLITASSILLGACGNHSAASTGSSSANKTKFANVAKQKHNKRKSNAVLKKKINSTSRSQEQSETKVQSKSNKQNASSSSNIDTSLKMQSSQSVSSSSGSQSTQPQYSSSGSSSISYDEKTLTGFLNKYGMSPVAYKIQHQGMSEYDALKSTPDTMKMSGEIQTEYMMDQGYLDHNGQETAQGRKLEQQNSDNDTTDTNDGNDATY
ncbi:hypothetical protein JCM15457_247 [Liquorilactobacillus sucicola DSM 21376 = JCM 15457]|uniref:Lipoprotein n=1 Tax=Liquorilactobacillus sucicola DSM 21376 = JCM 15457 TaxID=1423806 RepID=A0A023CUA9_9LACO|nr:hypothetical protein [Liquorilactobacillus sucicola]KRN05318.1 hypothetical protein FD15_GL001869 [Liquorilactobacillus sucicola DSM 21376 = JCM 15457]GAJ25384.1 hypothetical protein JCM15457_247 [Liquorilactobacillus sucicola DSM 21376 = JCM 15457]